MAITPASPVTLDSGNNADASFLGVGESTTNASSFNFGDYTMPSAGLMAVLAIARGTGAAADFSSCSMGGSNGTFYKLMDHSTTTDKIALFCRQVSSGAQNVTVALGGTLGTGVMEISVYYISGHTSDVPRIAYGEVTAPVTSYTMSYNCPGKSISLASLMLLATSSGHSYTGTAVTATDTAFNAIVADVAQYTVIRYKNTSSSIESRTHSWTWTSSSNPFYILAVWK